MPHYKQVICCLPKYPASSLVGLFKRHTTKVYEVGGVVRSIENHGVREFTEKAHRRFADAEGKKSFWSGRYVTVSMDISPQGLVELNRLHKSEEGILNIYTMKAKTSADRLETRNYKLPFKDLPFGEDVRKYLGTHVTPPQDETAGAASGL
mmetsp:Transcript_17254/g.28850  ORF Transcript_17254/g.28850 Transcript_17254/m.28850 type:complete len:151 (-) Transcript_17254:189-641(-)